jgi:sulfite exporter TauE/SafE
MVDTLGWISTILVLIGYVLNAKRLHNYAMISWIIGDIGWITYDFFIANFSHLVLSLIIIAINLYGIWNLLSTNKTSN